MIADSIAENGCRTFCGYVVALCVLYAHAHSLISFLCHFHILCVCIKLCMTVLYIGFG